jgi:hypothetical protein
MKAVLLDARAAALDQDNQHNDKQHTGNNPNNRGTVHCNSPFVGKQVEKSQALTGVRVTPAADAAGFPVRGYDADQRSPANFTAPLVSIGEWLLGAAAAALNQNAQNDNEQNTGNNTDQGCGIHCNPLSDSSMSHSRKPVEFSPTCWLNDRAIRALQAARQAGGIFVFQSSRQGIRTDCASLCARAAALNQNSKHDDKKGAGYDSDNRDTVHTDPPFLSYLNNSLNESIMMMIAGPNTTRNSDGKMKKTSGKISLMVVFAACSSIC